MKSKLARSAIRFRATARADKILVSADKNPNTNGARLTGICFHRDGNKLARSRTASRRAKSRRSLFSARHRQACGQQRKMRDAKPSAKSWTNTASTPELLAKAGTTLIVSDILRTTPRSWRIIFCRWRARGKTRHVHQHQGPRQKFMKAVEAPGDARAEWDFLHDLVHNVTGQNVL